MVSPVTNFEDETISTAASQHLIEAGSTYDGIVTATDKNHVIACATIQMVVPRTSVQDVRTVTALDMVVAGFDCNHIVAVLTIYRIIACAADHFVRAETTFEVII